MFEALPWHRDTGDTGDTDWWIGVCWIPCRKGIDTIGYSSGFSHGATRQF